MYIYYIYIYTCIYGVKNTVEVSILGTVCAMIIPGAHAAEDAAYTCLFYALMAL